MHTPEHRDSTLDLAWALWTRRKWLTLLAFSASFMAAASMTLALPDLYRATATVVVEQEMPESFSRPAVAGELEPRLQMVSQEILSRTRLQALITRFDLYPKLRKTASPEEVIERMRRDIRLERKEVEQRWGRGATVSFALSYQGWDPRTVAQVTNLLVSFYVEENEKIRGRQAAGTQAAGTVDLITPLKRQLAEMRTRFSDRYPDVIRLKAEIAALERHGRQAERASEPPSTSRPGENVKTTEQQSTEPKRHEEARRAGPLERRGDQFRILDAAIPPYEPVAPNRLRLLVMGLILSLGAAAAVVILAEQLDTSFHRVDDLRKFTHVPVLASVLRIDTRGDIWRHRLRFCVAAVMSGLVVVLIVRASYTFGKTGEQLVWILGQPGG